MILIKNVPIPIHGKNSWGTRNKGELPQFDKEHHQMPMANITPNGEKLEAFLLRLGTRQVYPFSLLLSNIVLEVLLNTVR